MPRHRLHSSELAEVVLQQFPDWTDGNLQGLDSTASIATAIHTLQELLMFNPSPVTCT
jgi:hypothetical protein